MATATISERSPAVDDSLYEMVDGCIQKKDVGAFSTLIAFRLAWRMAAFAEERKLGVAVAEMLFVLNAASLLKRRPDVAFVSAARWPLGRLPPAEGDWAVVPDLAAEFVSPNDTVRDVIGKVFEYFRHGVQEVWLIVPEQRIIHVYHSPTNVRILAEGDTLSTELLPGWSAPVGNVVPLIGESEANGEAEA